MKHILPAELLIFLIMSPQNRKKRNAILVWEENGGVLMNKNWSGFASRIPSKDLGFGNEKPFPEVDGGPLHLGP